jgi:hypothetical protein
MNGGAFEGRAAEFLEDETRRYPRSQGIALRPPTRPWPQSFPRKRESSVWTPHFRGLPEWIPAFAGMTGVG